MALLKMCGCGKTIAISKQSCDSCAKETHTMYDKYRRDKKSQAFYNSKAWKIKRVQALNKSNRLCVHCLKDKRIKYADMVDHIEPIKIAWHLRLDLNNLQALCNACHRVKTMKDKAEGKG